MDNEQNETNEEVLARIEGLARPDSAPEDIFQFVSSREFAVFRDMLVAMIGTLEERDWALAGQLLWLFGEYKAGRLELTLFPEPTFDELAEEVMSRMPEDVPIDYGVLRA